MAHRI